MLIVSCYWYILFHKRILLLLFDNLLTATAPLRLSIKVTTVARSTTVATIKVTTVTTSHDRLLLYSQTHVTICLHFCRWHNRCRGGQKRELRSPLVFVEAETKNLFYRRSGGGVIFLRFQLALAGESSLRCLLWACVWLVVVTKVLSA